MPQEFKSEPSTIDRFSTIATVVSLIMMAVTAFGLLPGWSILLVPLWAAILCYFNLDRLVSLALRLSES